MKFTSILSVVLLFNLAVNVFEAVAEVATTEVKVSGNLNSNSKIVDLPKGFDLSNFLDVSSITSSANFVAPFWVSDSVGDTHKILLTFFHNSSTSWVVMAYMDGGDILQVPGKAVTLGKAFLEIPSPEKAVSSTIPINLFWTETKRVRILLNLEFFSFDNKSIVEKIEITPNSCVEMNMAVNYAVETTAATYQLSDSCSSKLKSYVVTADQLADRAIKAMKCDTRKFLTRKECNQCFVTAAAPLKQKFDKSLFNGLLSKSNLLIAKKKEVVCSISIPKR